MKKEAYAINVKRFSWWSYIASFMLLGIIGAFPGIIYGITANNRIDIIKESGPYLFWYLLYWAIIAAIFTYITARQKHRAFDEPMRQLGQATKQVANGDFSIYLTPLNHSSKLHYLDIMFQDFNKMVEELGSLETLKTDFVANVSHELKTPLAVIQNYAEALHNQQLTVDQQQEYTATIISATENLSTLVTNILKLNKLNNQEILVAAEVYDVSRQLTDSLLNFESLLAEKKIQLQVDLEERSYLRTDPGMVEIIWRNILENALKFTSEDGTISLSQTSDQDSLTVIIKDNGCGMDEHTLKHLFDKFYQGDTSHSGKGNGLGLALVMRVIELIDGQITVTSQLEIGTTFVIKLKKG
ncbi:HAMP domain-containing sensor histidine kinase [uncultured Vagococcus sp.]|uniref:HAMP domain-containing sensor histidine kinase n=1 Tax=uncultured Vagococcus sp. TaxID=189676 RepID=UPI0028D740CA|nr:HAMP domain-containing sensor histidine kinase [uncultured Vagococcus sp.]